MSYWKSVEKRLDDGMVHYIDEYVCQTCNESHSIDLGLVARARNPSYNISILRNGLYGSFMNDECVFALARVEALSCPYSLPKKGEGKWCKLSNSKFSTSHEMQDALYLCFSSDADYTKCPIYQRRETDAI